MASKSGIEWTEATWNPWVGCKKVSPGCARCYAEREMERYGRDFNTVMRSKTTFDAPLRWWKRWQQGERDPKKTLAPGSRIFTCSWSDWMIDKADDWRAEAWEVVRATPYFYLILTKRIERVDLCLPSDWGQGWPNVMLVVSAEDQKRANARVPLLLNTPAAYRGVSAEPLLGPIDFCEASFGYPGRFWSSGETESIDWIVTGGESDFTSPRPFDLDWARQIRDWCLIDSVAYCHKQHGGTRKIAGTWGGRELDGVTHDGFPDVSHAFTG